ncbi:MAG: ferrous iron transporter B [Candidatus Omnitrophica bacterium]|nr:ferrous iron transporter B [Candidatus Omnitrophota bacterium]
MKRVFLIGNPNVGKSALFSRLTGIDVICSNYPGTTVEYCKGYIKAGDEKIEVIDVPGTYSLYATSKAEEVAVKMLEEGADIVINIVDSTNLERNLNLTLQLLKKNIPVIVALNFWDETKHKGISIDVKELEKLLGVPVVATCARTGEGIKELIDRLKEARSKTYEFVEEEKWKEIGKIINRVQKLSHKHHTFLDQLSEISIRPLTGILFALIVLYITFKIVRFIAEGLILLIEPIFNEYYVPFISNIVEKTIPIKFLQDLLLGTTHKVMESFGLLTTGLYIPFVAVLPYILSFYIVLGFLEDIGYLPRVGVLLDVFLHRIGVHGYTSIPILLGFGCKVPGMLATRILETEREKMIATALILMMSPCMPQTAMIISLVSPYGIRYLFLIFSILFFIAIINGFILHKILKGETPELFVEIPPYRLPYIPTLIKKLWIRLKAFLQEAVPMIIFGVFIAGVLDIFGITNFIAKIFGKPLIWLFGLPKEIVPVMILGFLRKDVSIALLTPFNLNIKQILIASVFMVLYLPCIATFFTLLKEMGPKRTAKIIFLMLFTAIFVSALLNLVL